MNKQTIAVIAENDTDFRNFKALRHHPEKVFVRVCSIEDCSGRRFHDLDETERAFLHDDYTELVQLCRARLIFNS